MCSPMVMMVGMAMMSMYQAYTSNEAQNKQMEAQAESANMAASYDYQRLAEKRGQVDEEAAGKKLQRQLQTQREYATVSVAAGEGGVGGNSVLRQMNNAMMQGSYDTSVIEANRMAKAGQINSEMMSVHAGNAARINEADAGTISPTMGALNVGMAGIQGGSEGYSMGKSFFGKKMDIRK